MTLLIKVAQKYAHVCRTVGSHIFCTICTSTKIQYKDIRRLIFPLCILYTVQCTWGNFLLFLAFHLNKNPRQLNCYFRRKTAKNYSVTLKMMSKSPTNQPVMFRGHFCDSPNILTSELCVGKSPACQYTLGNSSWFPHLFSS